MGAKGKELVPGIAIDTADAGARARAWVQKLVPKRAADEESATKKICSTEQPWTSPMWGGTKGKLVPGTATSVAGVEIEGGMLSGIAVDVAKMRAEKDIRTGI